MPKTPRISRTKKPFASTVSPALSHIDAKGQATMVDVGHKPVMRRVAVAHGEFHAHPSTLDRLMVGDLPKGEALGVARIAGIQAAKRTDELIPLCHSLPIDQIGVDFSRLAPSIVQVRATASVCAKTGVEMEALTGVMAACLTLYDMTKAIDKELSIQNVRLVSKTKEKLEGTDRVGVDGRIHEPA